MKKLSLFSVLMICVFFLAGTANATGLRNEFRAYEISSVDNLYTGKSIQKIWTISYSTNETPVTVLKMKTVEGFEYVVHAQYFEVSYASTSEGFGVKEIRSNWRNVPKKITKAVLNDEEMKRQAILTPNKVDDKMAIGLIASYLPDLVNDGYTHVLN